MYSLITSTFNVSKRYCTLEIEMKPDMQVSVERVRLAKLLLHLSAKVGEHIEDRSATSPLTRFGLRVRRLCRHVVYIIVMAWLSCICRFSAFLPFRYHHFFLFTYSYLPSSDEFSPVCFNWSSWPWHYLVDFFMINNRVVQGYLFFFYYYEET